MCLGCQRTMTETIVDGRKVMTMTLDMEPFLEGSVDHYRKLCEKSGVKANLKKVETPFVDTNTEDPEEGEETGVLSAVAASILMKILYAARMARFDLLKAIQMLASRNFAMDTKVR